MTDKREDVLARMFATLASIDGIKKATRNVDEFPAGIRPITNLFDGDEELPPEIAAQMLLTGKAPLIVTMLPLINLLVGDSPGALGTTVNQFGAAIKKAVLTDSALAAAAGAVRAGSGRIVYLGFNTRFSHSLAMDCDLQLRFAISYLLDPASL
jgi:hypothetical protein